MTNNDILRRVRYAFDFKDKNMIDIFAAADFTASKEQVSNWLKSDEDEAFVELQDVELASFLNGLINFKRGKREGEQPNPEEYLNNNMVFQKLRIALNLKADDILDIFKLADFHLSNHELSAFFRKPSSSNYRECKDQILRNFLQGVQSKFRSSDKS